MPEDTRRASLLGLPTELRLKIYQNHLSTEINCIVIKNIVHTIGSNGTQAKLLPNLSANLHQHIPWINLQLTCREIASEIGSYMAQDSFLNNDHNRTYNLDFDIYQNSGSEKAIRTATWRRLPCRPEDARILIMNVAAKRGSNPFTEGGAASLARALYQLLNHIVHNGPQIVARHRLSRHMHLRELIINIDIGKDCERPALGCNTVVEHDYQTLLRGWEQVSKTGFLIDYVGKTIIRRIGDEECEKEIPVKCQKLPSIPGWWRGYGFQWGV